MSTFTANQKALLLENAAHWRRDADKRETYLKWLKNMIGYAERDGIGRVYCGVNEVCSHAHAVAMAERLGRGIVHFRSLAEKAEHDAQGEENA